MTFVDVLRAYFHGERIESLFVMVPFGLASIGFAVALLLGDRSPFVVGVAVVFLLLGTALAGTGAAVGLRTPAQVAALERSYEHTPGAFAKDELARMTKVNANWPVYLATWTAFALLGLALRFATKSDAAQGVGIALVFFGGVGLLVDGFAERRARPYTEALTSLAGAPSVRETGAEPQR